MKTLQDLVKMLNRNDQLNDVFSTSGSRDRDYSIDINGEAIIVFCLEDRNYSFASHITWVNDKDQDLIVKYLANHTPDDWFPPEKKYNIIIGRDSDEPIYSAYKKRGIKQSMVSVMAFRDELRSQEEYQFTESEIEELKSKLSENMAKIVELGKVEVKDD